MRITRLGRADVYALTGITATQLDRIAASTDPGHRRGRPPGLTHRDRVLLTLVALRTNLTERALAALFDISRPTAHRIICDLTAAVAGLFVPDQFDSPTPCSSTEPLSRSTTSPSPDRARTTAARSISK
ncbi:MAG: transposase family protein [Mycobacterium sp.]